MQSPELTSLSLSSGNFIVCRESPSEDSNYRKGGLYLFHKVRLFLGVVRNILIIIRPSEGERIHISRRYVSGDIILSENCFSILSDDELASLGINIEEVMTEVRKHFELI